MRYTYCKNGNTSNITVKDFDPAPDPVTGEHEEYRWRRDLAMYYTSSGQLWRVLWDRWKVDASGQVLAGSYEPRPGAPGVPPAAGVGREFYYDGMGARFATREMTVYVDGPQAMTWKPTTAEQPWTDTLGLTPYADFGVTMPEGFVPDCIEEQFPPPVERTRYLPAGGAAGQQTVSTGETRYYHGDLVGSTMLTTDAGGNVAQPPPAVAYTAFGEPVGSLPSGFPRYGYAGEYGYERDMLVLDGAPGTAPITLGHLGARWYQSRRLG
ncbi:hypothetical protein RAS1_28020 [Phycisphaerae bacterium RAS1]|nr:hypothetical protein RAS1_28020 [Phycisphaerae bacterium RAS1]